MRTNGIQTVDAIAKWPESQEPNCTVRPNFLFIFALDHCNANGNHSQGFAFANSTDRPYFEDLARNPARMKRMANAMSIVSNGEGYEAFHIVDALPWEKANVKVFVDVGGSFGTSSIALAERYPSIQCIVQDLPHVISEGKPALSEELNDRVEFMAHDFFQEQPVKGADVYFFRWIFHDWSDKYCIKILHGLTPALKPGARLIICEFILPPPGEASAYQEWLAR